MKKVITYLLVICTFFACKEGQQKTNEEATQNKEEVLAKSKLNIPKKGKLRGLNGVQKNLVKDWIEFNTINESMKLVNTSTRFSIIEDLGQLAENIAAIEEKNLPQGLDVMQIRSRFLVLKTKALKLQDDAGDEGVTNDDIAKEIVEMNRVFHAVCNQIQQVTEQNIDPNEILGDLLNKDSIKVKKTPEVYKSSISEKPVLKPAGKDPKKTLQQ
ncbi:hypothetical protein [uncultured Kordia sp.]|uniref:hypothetical protein n=1 Tax=uncultured Kordia sp. TaxID=507699 RepID=UPI00260F9202|nr:hypothetical protein [uncultured Kordia sp.]